MGLGVLKTRAFLRALLSGKGRVWVRMLGEQGGRGRIYGISPPAGNKGRFLCPA